MSQERPNATTLKGNPLTLIGPELKVGEAAPDFTVVANDLSEFKFSSTRGKTRIISVVPSLDTPVCDAQTRRFNEEAAKLGEQVAILTISMDLPFAQKRWCGNAGVDRVKTYSDHRHADFSSKYGTLIKELRIDSRAVFVVDLNDKLQHVEYVREVAEHPDYDAALEAARKSSRAAGA